MPTEISLRRDFFYDQKDQFVFVGRLDELKGIDLLMHAWKLLGNQFSKLIICGTGPLDDWCRDFIKENRIQNVELRGFLPNDDIKKIIRESKALILPTRLYEGFPMSLVEAYSVGIPVIGSNIGNVSNLIKCNVTGMTFKYNDVFSLKNVVSEFKGKEWENIKRYYEEHFGEERNYKILMHIYEMAT